MKKRKLKKYMRASFKNDRARDSNAEKYYCAIIKT